MCDTFYERDGATEKIRSLSSEGKVGSYQLISTICGLFNAYPVYHGATKTVDIHALANKQPLKEMIVGKNLTALTTDYDSDCLVTRLFVEGEYGEDGYVGIDDVNPTGLSYILNFDYYKKLGIFTDEHQAALDAYLEVIKNNGSASSECMGQILELENVLNELWGQPDFVYYKSGTVYFSSSDLPDADKKIEAGDQLYELLGDGTYRIVTAPVSTTNDLIKFVTPTSATIGAKEAAIEAKKKIIKSFQKEPPTSAISEKISALENEIEEIYLGNEEGAGLYVLMRQAANTVQELKVLYEEYSIAQARQNSAEGDFLEVMGDFIRDGYWSNTNYIAGQEEFLYQDALDISAELAFPKVTYTISLVHASDIWGE